MKTKIILLLFIALLMISCTAENQDTYIKTKTAVKLVDVKQKKISMPIYTSGVLAAKDELLLSFKTGGILKKILVHEGQSVKAGQLLARLDLAEISAYKKQARAAFDKARRDLQRIENLFEENVATLEQKQNAQSAFDVAQANLQVATFNEKHSKITAPENGKVLKIFPDEAELLNPGTPVVSFGSTEKAYILKVGLTDKDIVLVQKGDPAEIKFDAYPGKIFQARISEISGSAMPGSGTFEVELQLEQNNPALFSGFIGKATIKPQNRLLLSTIPVNALNEANETAGFVYIATENNLAKKERIDIAYIMDDSVAFYNTLNLTQVINEGNAYLFEKSPVEIIK